MKAFIIRSPFWFGAALVAYMHSLELPISIGLPIAYLLGYAACNVSINIIAWYKRQADAIQEKYAYKDKAKW